jgi:hypothetical protein
MHSVTIFSTSGLFNQRNVYCDILVKSSCILGIGIRLNVSATLQRKFCSRAIEILDNLEKVYRISASMPWGTCCPVCAAPPFAAPILASNPP